MRDRLADALLCALIGTLVWLAMSRQPPHVPAPPLPVQPVPMPQPVKPDKPKRPRDRETAPGKVIGEAKVGGTTSPDGKEEVQVYVPDNLHVKNCGGRDGSGLCVFTSIQIDARAQNVPALADFQQWMRKNKNGGGWPQKVDECIKEYCKEQGVPVPEYIQVEGNDLTVLKAALAGGRPAGVTYSYSPTGRYGGGHVAHMVSCFHCTEAWVAIADNNYIGMKNLEWMDPATFKKVCAGGGKMWFVIFLNPAAAPAPHN